MTTPAIGSKWKDNDPRMSGRVVEVVQIEGDRAVIRNTGGKSTTKALLKNFGRNGTRGFSEAK